MHLVIVNQYGLPAGAPGITRHGDLGAELVRRGHAVTVIASSFNYLTRGAPATTEADPKVQHDGVSFRWLRTGRYRGNDRFRVIAMVRFAVAATMVGLRMRPRPDVVLASSPHLLAVIPGWAIARRHRIPFLFEVRDLWPSALVDLGGLRRGGLAHRVLEFLERRAYAWADRIVMVPPHGARRVAEVGGDPGRCVHIPNATALPSAPAEPAPASLTQALDAVGPRSILMYSGAQGPSNGLDTLLASLDLLRDGHPSVYAGLAVFFVGDGSEHDRLVREARRRGHTNVAFHPPVGKAAMAATLARADILLVSFADAPVYDYGLSPNKLFDYLWVGRPVLLASRLTDTPVTEADAGRCYEPGSPASLAAALVDLLATPPSERAAMGERGRRLVEKRFTIPTTASLLERELVGLVERAR